MEDASYVWWAIRPSLEHPTLELRAPDCCTLVEDTVAIAALYRVLARHLTRNPLVNQNIGAVERAIAVENKWRAQRYGVRGTFVSEIGAVSVAEMLDQLLEEIAPDAAALGCLGELRHCRTIVGAGTSADTQLAVFEQHRHGGSHARALRAVTDWIAAATLQ
jgi:carboxylate-amine ligase